MQRYNPHSDLIQCAWSENASGPVWSNHMVNVLILDRFTHELRIETFQPHEMTDEMRTLHASSEVITREMTRISKVALEKAVESRAA